VTLTLERWQLEHENEPIEGAFDELEHYLNTHTASLDALIARYDALEAKLTALETRLSAAEAVAGVWQ
jgi:hypothetical protein